MINSANKKRVEALVERSTKHGQAGRSGKSPTYLIWQSMIGRCHRPTDSSYKYYGAKGVIVCERWRKFENFFEDMGTAPEGTHIHMRDDATIYSKKTCQWLNEKEHIGLHNQQRGWGARLNKAQLIDRVVALQDELAAERQRREQAEQIQHAEKQILLDEVAKNKSLSDQLLSALAAIEKAKALAAIWDSQRDNQDMNDPSPGDKALEALHQFLVFIRGFHDLSALHEHDAEVTQKALCCDVDLHQDTKDLVVRFARALAEKLASAEKKYGFTNGWADADFDELRESLVDHLIKGDPRDVANFCAFLWHCGESTENALDEHDAKVREPLVEALEKVLGSMVRYEWHADPEIKVIRDALGEGERAIRFRYGNTRSHRPTTQRDRQAMNPSYQCPACQEWIEILPTSTKNDLRCPWCNERLRLDEDINPCRDDSKFVTFSSHWDDKV